MGVLWAHLQEEPPDPRVLRPELPDALVAAVLAGLAKEPEDRPQSTVAYAAGHRGRGLNNGGRCAARPGARRGTARRV